MIYLIFVIYFINCMFVQSKEEPKLPTTVAGYRNAKTMCAKYAESVFELRENPTPGDPPLNISLCHSTKFIHVIVGGRRAKPREYPHMALIGYDYEPIEPDQSNITWACGGSLINEQWVLTAAHCLESNDYGPAKYVRLGELDYSRTNDLTETQDFTVVARVPKKQPDDPTQYDDIGLLKLHTSAKFNEFVRPACLWTESNLIIETAVATGWGYKADPDDPCNVTSETSEPSTHLLTVMLEYQQFAQCKNFYQREYGLPKGIDNATQICFGGERGKDTCQGDSGGPLQIDANDFYCMHYIIGVTSTGLSCCGFAPAIYTRVSAYVTWIEKIVWNSEN